MNEYLKILREISKLWKNGKFDNGSMLIKNMDMKMFALLYNTVDKKI